MEATTALLADPVFREHLAGRKHPERAERFDAVMEGLRAANLMDALVRVAARAATEEELLACHTVEYLRAARRDVESGRPYLSTGDTDITRNSWDVAAQAAGGTLNAVDAVISGRARNAFCAVRPPGHHATRGRGMGFCLLNNAALAARYAQRRHGLGRILIVDWDLHHGNGTAETFYEDRQVLYFSTHQSPGYPGTGGLAEMGRGPGLGYTINVPLRPGADDAFYVRVFRELLCPVARMFRPEVILVSAGFDIYVGDPLGEMKVTPEGFACLTRVLLNLADECCNGRLVLVLEGGYNIQGLTKSVRAVLQELLGETRVTEETLNRMTADTDETCSRLIGRVREKIGPFWPVF